MATSVTQNDLLDALRAATTRSENEGGMTMFEIVKATGWGDDKCRGVIRDLIDLGQVEVVFASRQSMTGIRMRVPTYLPKILG